MLDCLDLVRLQHVPMIVWGIIQVDLSGLVPHPLRALDTTPLQPRKHWGPCDAAECRGAFLTKVLTEHVP